MKIKGSIALVTGANRGLGAAFARGLLAAGAAKVYAAARDPASVTLPGVVPMRLDVTQPEHIAALARELTNVMLLVNNAGIAEFGPLLEPNAIDALHRQFETNAVGPLRLVQAFAPVLAGNGGGAVVNVLSVLSWLTMQGTGGYSAPKATGWALSNALRQEMKAQGTELLAVHSAVIDTDMGRGAQGQQIAPRRRRAAGHRRAGSRAARAAGRSDDSPRACRAGGQPRVYIGA